MPGLLIEGFRRRHLWVFREGKKHVRSRDFVRELQKSISSNRLPSPQPDLKLDVLIRAGELEAGLADQGSPAAWALKNLTDLAASALINAGEFERLFSCCAYLDRLELPDTLFISPPEGFAYYALHPWILPTARRLSPSPDLPRQ